MSDPHSGGPVTQPHPTHLDNNFSYHGYVTSTPMMDGQLLARPLVLDEVQPATLRASTSMSRQTKSSVMRPSDQCPPAACPRSGTGVWPGGDGSSAAALPSHPSQTPRIQLPPHSRPLAKGLRPKIVIRMPHTSRGRAPGGGLMPPSRRPPSLGNDHLHRLHVVGGGTQGTRGGVEVGPARAGQYRPAGCVRPDWHHPQPDPSNGVRDFPLLRRAAEDTLAHGHARVRNGHARASRDTLAHRHARARYAFPPAGGPREPSPICSADENR